MTSRVPKIGQGDEIDGSEEVRHFLSTSAVWLFKQWGIFDQDCVAGDEVGPPDGQTSDRPEVSGQENYAKGALVLLAMHVFTLTTWFQLKIYF